MVFLKTQHPKNILFLTIFLSSLFQPICSAKLEQILLPINHDNKKVTFTFYHFDATKTATLTHVTQNIAHSATLAKASAAISASSTTNSSYQSGKFSFSKNANYFINNGEPSNISKSPRIHKHTLVLTDRKGHHAITYTPNLSETQLQFALKHYFLNNKQKFNTAVVLESGSQSGFYKNNGSYHPYYLKELKKPAKALIISAF